MSIELIVIDHDGVIVDSNEDIYLAAWELMASHSFGRRRIPSFLDFLTTFSLPGDQWFRAHNFKFPAAEISEALRQVPNRATMFPAVPTLLKRIQKESKLPVIMVSAGDPSRIENQLAIGGIRHHFEIVSGGNSDKTMALSFFCSAFDVKPANTVYVGDMSSDMEHSLKAGVTPIGFTDDRLVMEEVLTKAGAQHCVPTHEKLGDLLLDLARS